MNLAFIHIFKIADPTQNKRRLRTKSSVQIPSGPPKETYPEPHSQALEEFLAMLRFEQRHKLAELPSDIMTEVVRDDYFFAPK